MHPDVFRTFDELCRAHGARGDVLEVGAVPVPDTLLLLPALAGATSRTGVNLAAAATIGGFPIHGANAKDLGAWASASFDTVLCNSVLEHEAQFWRILAEVRRVARPGALIVHGVPGYAEHPSSALRLLLGRAVRLPVLSRLLAPLADRVLASTETLVVHRFPGDYYRFSEQACREVFLEGLEPLELRRVLRPPRFIAAGRRPLRASAA